MVDSKDQTPDSWVKDPLNSIKVESSGCERMYKAIAQNNKKVL